MLKPPKPPIVHATDGNRLLSTELLHYIAHNSKSNNIDAYQATTKAIGQHTDIQ